MYLVTGGAGFIGSNIVHALVAGGQRVRVLDNLATGHLRNLADVMDVVEFTNGDIRDLDTCRKAMDGVRVVLHQAALPSVPRSLKDPLSSHAVNVNGTINLLVAARDQGVERFVYASSSSVYGDKPTLPKVETMAPNPRSPYAASKLAGEYYCHAFASSFGLSTVCLRYFNVYGRHQDPQTQYAAVIPRFVRALLKGERPTVYGDGEQSRDFTYIADCVAANLLACSAPGLQGEVLNIAFGGRTTINDLLNRIARLLGVEPLANFESARPGDVKHSLAEISKARRVLSYQPKNDIAVGLEEAVRWYRSGGGEWE